MISSLLKHSFWGWFICHHGLPVVSFCSVEATQRERERERERVQRKKWWTPKFYHLVDRKFTNLRVHSCLSFEIPFGNQTSGKSPKSVEVLVGTSSMNGGFSSHVWWHRKVYPVGSQKRSWTWWSPSHRASYPLVMTNIAMGNGWKWPIEIDGLPIENGWFSMAMLVITGW